MQGLIWSPITGGEVFIPVVGAVHVQRLFQDLHQKLRKGQPGFHCASYKIRENEFFHIPKDQEVGMVVGEVDHLYLCF
jgi:hypothetical protein